MLHRKDYVLMANVFKRTVEQTVSGYDGSNTGAEILMDRLDTLKTNCSNLCDQLQLDNSKFSPTRFIEACGLKEVKLDAGAFEWKW